MNAKDFANFLIDELDTQLSIHLKPGRATDHATLDVEDSEGNAFVLKVIQVNTPDSDEEDESVGAVDLDDID